jgi:hypothetical protein
MIDVDFVVDRCENRLSLKKRKDYEPLDVYQALNEAVMQVLIDCPQQSDYVPITTVAARADYVLPPDVNRVQRIEFPTDWAHPVEPKTVQYIGAMRATTEAAVTSYPTCYALWRNLDGTMTLSVEPHGGIIADLTIKVFFFPVAAQAMTDGQGNVITTLARGGQIALPPAAELMVKAALTWKLAEQYAIDKAAYWQMQYEVYKNQFLSTQYLLSNEVHQARNTEAY